MLLWAREPGLAERITAAHENPDYLPGQPLHPELRATAVLSDAAEQADVVVMAVPTHAFRQVLAELAPRVRPWIPVVSAAKGFEEHTNKRMTEVITQELPGHPAGVLSGPTLAKEVLEGLAAAAVLAIPDLSVAQRLQSLMRTSRFRVYTATDVIGVEVGGAVKNVVAIAAGMADGLGTGDNTRALVISRGVAEMTRLGVAMGGSPDFEAMLWRLEADPRLRSPVAALEVLDRTPDWDRFLAAHEWATRILPRAWMRVVDTPLRLGNPPLGRGPELRPELPRPAPAPADTGDVRTGAAGVPDGRQRALRPGSTAVAGIADRGPGRGAGRLPAQDAPQPHRRARRHADAGPAAQPSA